MKEQFYAIDFVGMAMILLAVTIISLKDLLLEIKSSNSKNPLNRVDFCV